MPNEVRLRPGLYCRGPFEPDLVSTSVGKLEAYEPLRLYVAAFFIAEGLIHATIRDAIFRAHTVAQRCSVRSTPNERRRKHATI